MAESLYSDSPCLLVLSVLALLLSYPMLMSSKMTAKALPSALRQMIIINIAWNLGGVIGILFFDGTVEVGTPQYIGRMILFGLQAIFWIRLTLVTYSIGELVVFNKSNSFGYLMSVLSGVVVLLLTLLLIFAPEAVAGITVLGMHPFEKAPIFSSFAVAYILFVAPFGFLTVYQLLRGTLHSLDATITQTGA